MKQTKQTPEAMPIDKGNGHTSGKVRLGSNLPFDEYACNILTEQNYPIAIAQTNIYFDAETAEANAARIVECWNNYDRLKSLSDHIVAMADDAYLTGHPEWNTIVNEAKNAKLIASAPQLKAENEKFKEQWDVAIKANDYMVKEDQKHRDLADQLKAENESLLTILNEVLNDWHNKPSNFNKKEPAHMEKIRKAIAKHNQ